MFYAHFNMGRHYISRYFTPSEMICGMKVLPTCDLNVDPHIIFVNLLNYKSTNIVVLPLQ